MLIDITFYQIFGKPFILYLGILALISFSITAMLGIIIHKRWSKINFIWHPTMVGISFSLAIIMGVLGRTVGSPFIGILGIITLISFSITAMLGIIIYKRWSNIRFIWHPTMVGISFSLAIIHGALGILLFL
jgi:hypothetical protein